MAIQEVTETEMKALDTILIIDHSGSMGEPSMRLKGKSRMEEVQEDVVAIARIAEKYDDDGLTVVAFSGSARVFDGVTSERVASVFKEFPPRGTTNLAAALQEAVTKAKASTKEVVAIVFTDGIPDDEAAVISTIKSAASALGRPKLGFTIVQVGEDTHAAAFLDQLDNKLKSESVPDIVATVKAADAESLSLQQLAWLARNA